MYGYSETILTACITSFYRTINESYVTVLYYYDDLLYVHEHKCGQKKKEKKKTGMKIDDLERNL